MFEKFKKIFGGGKANPAAVVRSVVSGEETQSVLFLPENAQALKAFVEYGHEFDNITLCMFFKEADSRLIKLYLEMGWSVSEKAREVLLDRKDDELVAALMEAGSWAPFPLGCCMHHPVGKHHEDQQHKVSDQEIGFALH